MVSDCDYSDILKTLIGEINRKVLWDYELDRDEEIDEAISFDWYL